MAQRLAARLVATRAGLLVVEMLEAPRVVTLVERLRVERLRVERLRVERLRVERLPVERLRVERLPVERLPVERQEARSRPGVLRWLAVRQVEWPAVERVALRVARVAEQLVDLLADQLVDQRVDPPCACRTRSPSPRARTRE